MPINVIQTNNNKHETDNYIDISESIQQEITEGKISAAMEVQKERYELQGKIILGSDRIKYFVRDGEIWSRYLDDKNESVENETQKMGKFFVVEKNGVNIYLTVENGKIKPVPLISYKNDMFIRDGENMINTRTHEYLLKNAKGNHIIIEKGKNGEEKILQFIYRDNKTIAKWATTPIEKEIVYPEGMPMLYEEIEIGANNPDNIASITTSDETDSFNNESYQSFMRNQAIKDSQQDLGELMQGVESQSKIILGSDRIKYFVRDGEIWSRYLDDKNESVENETQKMGKFFVVEKNGVNIYLTVENGKIKPVPLISYKNDMFIRDGENMINTRTHEYLLKNAKGNHIIIEKGKNGEEKILQFIYRDNKTIAKWATTPIEKEIVYPEGMPMLYEEIEIGANNPDHIASITTSDETDSFNNESYQSFMRNQAIKDSQQDLGGLMQDVESQSVVNQDVVNQGVVNQDVVNQGSEIIDSESILQTVNNESQDERERISQLDLLISIHKESFSALKKAFNGKLNRQKITLDMAQNKLKELGYVDAAKAFKKLYKYFEDHKKNQLGSFGPIETSETGPTETLGSGSAQEFITQKQKTILESLGVDAIESGYRSPAYQLLFFIDAASKSNANGTIIGMEQTFTSGKAAPPFHSEHGAASPAIDFKLNDFNDPAFEQNLKNKGFTKTYPAGSNVNAGFGEHWHWMLNGENSPRIEPNQILYSRPSQNNEKLQNFRNIESSDIQEFSSFLSDIDNAEKLNEYLEQHKDVWNPNENPDLYASQHCVDSAVSVMIEYFWKKNIDLVFPAGDTYLRMSNYKTANAYREALYPRMSASHFANGGGIMDEIEPQNAKPGDLVYRKYPHSHDVKILTSELSMDANNPVYNLSYNSVYTAKGVRGKQKNDDFRNKEKERREVAKLYPEGYIDIQPGVLPENIQMKPGGYGIKPYFFESYLLKGSKVFRLNPDKLNELINK